MNSKPIEPLAYFSMLKQGELFPPEQMSNCFGICPKRPTALPIGWQELSNMSEPEKVALLFRRAATEPEIEKPTKAKVGEDEE